MPECPFGWSGGRLVGWLGVHMALFWYCSVHCSGLVLYTVLALFWPVPALARPTNYSVYALVPTWVVRVFAVDPGPPPPWVHPTRTTRVPATADGYTAAALSVRRARGAHSGLHRWQD